MALQAAVLKSAALKKFLKSVSNKSKKVEQGRKDYASMISPIVYKDIIDHFQEERGPKGAWEKWSDSYKDAMMAKGKVNNKILQDTGRLRGGITPTNYKSIGAGILWFNPQKTKSGFPYAAAHDEGHGRLPRRQFMWLSNNAMKLIRKATFSYILGK